MNLVVLNALIPFVAFLSVVNMREIKNVLITGGCGFIGSNFIRYLLETERFSGEIHNIDKLTYAGNPFNLEDLADRKNYHFYKEDINNTKYLIDFLNKYDIDVIVHTAAESHVDKSISGPKDFIETNIVGTFSILESIRALEIKKGPLLVAVSTDEVFGNLLNDDDYFFEYSSYDPKSPYSASKASADHLVRSYYHTYGTPSIITNCSNNYGPYQFPEKLIPLMVLNMLEDKLLPIYGNGSQIRD